MRRCQEGLVVSVPAGRQLLPSPVSIDEEVGNRELRFLRQEVKADLTAMVLFGEDQRAGSKGGN